MNLIGVYLSFFMLFAIGFGFFWVIKLEYYFGARIWKAVLVLGLVLCAGSVFMPTFESSAVMGIFGGSVVWGATELPDQEERVRQGHFPANPRRVERASGGEES